MKSFSTHLSLLTATSLALVLLAPAVANAANPVPVSSERQLNAIFTSTKGCTTTIAEIIVSNGANGTPHVEISVNDWQFATNGPNCVDSLGGKNLMWGSTDGLPGQLKLTYDSFITNPSTKPTTATLEGSIALYDGTTQRRTDAKVKITWHSTTSAYCPYDTTKQFCPIEDGADYSFRKARAIGQITLCESDWSTDGVCSKVSGPVLTGPVLNDYPFDAYTLNAQMQMVRRY